MGRARLNPDFADAHSGLRLFECEGSHPFTYTRGKKSGRPTRHALPYWRLPERLYDDPDELAVWAGRAFAVAERKRLAPRRRTKRKPARKDGKK